MHFKEVSLRYAKPHFRKQNSYIAPLENPVFQESTLDFLDLDIQGKKPEDNQTFRSSHPKEYNRESELF